MNIQLSFLISHDDIDNIQSNIHYPSFDILPHNLSIDQDQITYRLDDPVVKQSHYPITEIIYNGAFGKLFSIGRGKLLKKIKMKNNDIYHYYITSILHLEHTISNLISLLPQNIVNVENVLFHKSSDHNIIHIEYLIDHVDGITLLSFLETCFDREIILKIFLQLIIILIKMNTNGFVHNDIKLDNMMITKDISDINFEIIINKKKMIIEMKDTYIVKLIDYDFLLDLKKNIIPIEIYVLIELFRQKNIIPDIIDHIIKIINSLPEKHTYGHTYQLFLYNIGGFGDRQCILTREQYCEMKESTDEISNNFIEIINVLIDGLDN